MENYIIGVDAGGTKVLVQAFSKSGKILLEKTEGCANITVDFHAATQSIIGAVNEIIELSKNQPSGICVGCAGIETGNLKEQLRIRFNEEEYGCPVHITNDAMLALYGALKGDDGILVIGGTGSIGYLKKDDEIHRFGGWGHLINDDGSGYSIAIKAIRFICYGFDTNNSETPLKTAIFEELNITKLEDLIQFVYRSTKAQIASLSSVVEKTADTGDAQALDILNWAGERLAYLAISLYNGYSVRKGKIAISGGILKNSKYVKAAFVKTLNSQLSDYKLVDKDFSPASGGYYLLKDTIK